MANTIRIKRRPSSGSAGAPSSASLYNGELAFNENDNILYYAYGSGVGGISTVVPAIAGSGAYSLRGGSNATGVWPIGITGNSATVTSGVYTSRTLTAGSGLAGGGDLSSDKTFNIGQGDGITVSADAIAVDSTVVRTTGTQSVGGVKTFNNRPVFNSGIALSDGIPDAQIFLTHNLISSTDGASIGISDNISFSASNTSFNYSAAVGENVSFYDNDTTTDILRITDRISVRSPNGVVSGTYFPVWVTNPSGSAQAISSRTATQLKGDIGLGNVTNDAQIKKLSSTSGGFIPTWNGTTGDALNIGYGVETTLTGGSSALPRADAVKTYVDNLLGANDAMVFKGTIGTGGNATVLPTTHQAGWAYRVITAATYAGKVCEIGDLLIAIVDRSGSSNTNDDWTAVQTNLDGAVIGPASSTDNRFALFNGATGKIIKDAGFSATTVGQNLISLTNPSAITFPKINADNTVSTESAATHRTSIGATTVGSNFFTLTNPNAVSFIRVNLDNSITSRSASEFKTDLSLDNVQNTALSTWAGSTNLTTLGTVVTGTWNATTIAVDKGGTGQTSYTNGQLLIGNTTGNTLTKATLTPGTAIDINNSTGSITIGHNDTSTLSGAQGSNGIASFTVDGMGHVTAVTTATYLTAATVCTSIVDCSLDGGTL